MVTKLNKLNLLENNTIKETLEIDNTRDITEKGNNNLARLEPIFNLFIKFEELQYFFKKDSMAKIFYFNRKKVHEILYDKEEFIRINSNEKTISLNYLFYLVLLINDNKEIVNYKYSIDYIKDIFELIKEEKEALKKLILVKVLFELIDNYKNFDEYREDEEEEKLNQLIKFCENITNDLNNIGLKKDLKDIKANMIDEIYIQIIIWLIKNNKFEDDNYANNIIKNLDLESINITNLMFKKLFNFLENGENLLKYEISKIDDLFDNKKVCFYYFLFKYILKNTLYIYQIPFLLNNKRKLLLIIKKDFKKLNLKKIDKKLKYIIETFLDSKYYIKLIEKKFMKYYMKKKNLLELILMKKLNP